MGRKNALLSTEGGFSCTMDIHLTPMYIVPNFVFSLDPIKGVCAHMSQNQDFTTSPSDKGDKPKQVSGDQLVLSAENVSKIFIDQRSNSTHVAVANVSFSSKGGTFTSIVGPSGCGKSTVLNICAGLITPDQGRVTLNGNEMRGVNTDCGYVTQDANLLPWLTVWDNIMLPLKIKGMNKNQREVRVREWLELVGLSKFADYFPGQLSGGMQKRCSIARSLVYDPPVILLDEPFGPLDAITRQELQQEFLNLWEGRNEVVVFVTHDLAEAVALSDQVVIMTKGPGRIVDIAEVPLPRPRDILAVTESSEFIRVLQELRGIFRKGSA